MKLTTKSEYSLLALIYIARNEKKGFVKVGNICSKYKIPQKYLEQLLLTFKQSGLLKARRGAVGGYKLALPAQKITIAQIIRVMDGALAPVESVSKYFYSHTPLEKEKKTLMVFKEIRDYIADKLENLKLSDIA